MHEFFNKDNRASTSGNRGLESPGADFLASDGVRKWPFDTASFAPCPSDVSVSSSKYDGSSSLTKLPNSASNEKSPYMSKDIYKIMS